METMFSAASLEHILRCQACEPVPDSSLGPALSTIHCAIFLPGILKFEIYSDRKLIRPSNRHPLPTTSQRHPTWPTHQEAAAHPVAEVLDPEATEAVIVAVETAVGDEDPAEAATRVKRRSGSQ